MRYTPGAWLHFSTWQREVCPSWCQSRQTAVERPSIIYWNWSFCFCQCAKILMAWIVFLQSPAIQSIPLVEVTMLSEQEIQKQELRTWDSCHGRTLDTRSLRWMESFTWCGLGSCRLLVWRNSVRVFFWIKTFSFFPVWRDEGGGLNSIGTSLGSALDSYLIPQVKLNHW